MNANKHSLSKAQGVTQKGDNLPNQKPLKQGDEYNQFQNLKFTLKALIKSNGQENLLYYDNSRSWHAQ